MNAEQKQRAMQMLRRFSQTTPMTRTADNAAVAMAALLQELVDAQEALPATNPSQISSSAEPFGYFKAEPFGWTDCAETDDGAIALYTAPPAQSVPDGLHLLISGAVYDFAGFLTTREKTIQVGARVGADIVVDLLKEWAALRGLKLDDAAVLSWQEWLSPTPPEPPADVARDAEPVARVTGYYGGYLSISTIDGRVLPAGTALYLAPPAPSVPDGWMRAIDEAMVVHHIGIADRADGYEEAKKKLNELLAINSDIARYFSEPPADVAHELTLSSLRKKLGLPEHCAERRILCAIDELIAKQAPADLVRDAKPDIWRVMCGDWRDKTVAIHNSAGYITCGLDPAKAAVLVRAHNGEMSDGGAAIAEVKGQS